MPSRKRATANKAVSKKVPAKKPVASPKRAPRKMPAFTKPSAKTLDAFARAVDGVAGIEHRTMFGYPSVFLNGNMLACVFQDRIMVRLSETDRADASRVGGKPFEPSPGRAMKEYVELPARVADDPSQLNGWLRRGRDYVRTLPKKSKARR
jgi:TfoX/Sxy family transcriptional regulator of competence genes